MASATVEVTGSKSIGGTSSQFAMVGVPVDGSKSDRMLILAFTAANKNSPDIRLTAPPRYGPSGAEVPMTLIPGSENVDLKFGWRSRTEFYYLPNPVGGSFNNIIADVAPFGESWAMSVISLYGVKQNLPTVLGSMTFPEVALVTTTANFTVPVPNMFAVSSVNIVGGFSFSPGPGMTEWEDTFSSSEMHSALGSKFFPSSGSGSTQWSTIGGSTFVGSQVVVGVLAAEEPDPPTPPPLPVVSSVFTLGNGDAPNIFAVTVPTESGFVYQLERSIDGLSTFQDVGSSIAGTDDTNLVLADSDAPTGNAYYKVYKIEASP